MIINKECGPNVNDNPWQGSFAVDYLTDMGEEAVYKEFESISERGGVLGAMDTMYQRGKIQEESMYYEHKKHDGSLPLIGVNTFLAPPNDDPPMTIELARATESEKQSQLDRLHAFHAAHRDEAPAALAALQKAAMDGGNVFEELMRAVRCCSLGQISDAFFAVGRQYGRHV